MSRQKSEQVDYAPSYVAVVSSTFIRRNRVLILSRYVLKVEFSKNNDDECFLCPCSAHRTSWIL